MGTLHRHWPTAVLVGMVPISFLLGWLIPGFYAWTDSDQSRPSALLWQVPMLGAGLAVFISTALPWFPISDSAAGVQTQKSVRFSLRFMFLLTAVFAIAVAAPLKYPLAGGGVVSVGMIVVLVRFYWRHPQHRLATISLVACLTMPFAWCLGYRELDRILSTVIALMGALPSLFPTALLSMLLDQNFRDAQGLSYALTAAELGVGLWLIRLGVKRTIAYLLLVMLTSFMGSLIFYQLCVA